jgi:hypothetical protein
MKTNYSELTNDEMENLHNELTLKYGKYLLDASRPSEEREITKLVAARYKDKTQQNREIRSVCDFFLEYIYRNMRELSMIIYLAMRKTNNFGPHGEERISISFCRCINDISNDCQVTSFDAIILDLLLDECDRRNGCKSGEEYKAYCNNYSINIFGRQCTAADFNNVVNELFKLLGMDCFLWATLSSPYGVRVCLGILEEHEIEKNKIFIMKKELIRSPQLISSIAAEVYRDSTIIRKVAFEIIFRNKWVEYFNQSASDREIALLHDYSAIREGFKRLALNHYGIFKKEDVRQKKEAFLSDQMFFTICHELGHHIGNKDMRLEHYDFHWVFTNTDSIGSTLEEALADYAPQKDTKKGAILSFLEMARTNIKVAAANVFCYLSDYWFLDEDEDEYYGIRSNVMVGAMISFIKPDGTVDFDRLAAQIERFYIFFHERYGDLIDKLLSVIRNAEYDFEIKKIDYPALEQRIYEMHQGTRNAKPLDELRHSYIFWENAVDFLKKHSVEGWKRYQQVIAEETISVQQALLNMITYGNGEKYNNSLRVFIVEKAKECGIIEPPNADRLAMTRQMSQINYLLSRPYTVFGQAKING